MNSGPPTPDSEDDEGLHLDSDMPLGDEAVDDRFTDAGLPMREAAVLVPLIRAEDAWHLLFIRRAADERDRHSGQVAFPGGARDSGDTDAGATAVREAQEEIGLDPRRITLIRELGPYVTISNYRVTPVVGLVEWPSPLELQASEVARAFTIPLDWLRDRNNLTIRPRGEKDPEGPRLHPIIVYDAYDGETLWGATARMTINFIRSLDGGSIPLPPSIDLSDR